MKTISAAEFAEKCADILDEVNLTGETVTILRHGKPFAQLVPLAERTIYPQDTLKGTGRITGDIIEPPLPPEAWNAECGEYKP